MKCFLTSSPVIPGTETLNPENGFAERLRAAVKDPCRALFICSDPEGIQRTERFAGAVKTTLNEAGFLFSRYDILDSRNREQAAELVRGARLIILAGGHVPTQNRFFGQIGLREILRGYDGAVVGISAGSMNCARVVYAHPELPGEGTDPGYQKFLPGLALTGKMILPHYQMIRDDVLDGLRVLEDIAYPDSAGRRFYVLVDGSYLYIENGREEICGEAYLLSDGRMKKICSAGQTLPL